MNHFMLPFHAESLHEITHQIRENLKKCGIFFYCSLRNSRFPTFWFETSVWTERKKINEKRL